MGAANVVPGVSGGTIALITGIYERLIEALRSFDLASLKLLGAFQIRELWRKSDGLFLLALGLGVVSSILTLAKVLKWGFAEHPTLIWSLFFGLIAASVPSVGRMIGRWSGGVILLFLLGMTAAVSMAFLNPASQNSGFFYLMLCGVAAMCSMIIPGLSGSFVLLLMGNYELVALDTVNALRTGDLGQALPVLIPVAVGAVLGLLVLSRLLAWLFQNHHDKALGTIAGFVAGSLAIIWPWKEAVTETFRVEGREKEKIVGYENWHLPDLSTGAAWGQLLTVVIGILLILAVEFCARQSRGEDEAK